MLTRRKFVSNGCALGVASAVAPFVSATTCPELDELSGYRAIVCINLAGGNDSFNMMVPTGRATFGLYRRARGNLALEQADLLHLPWRDQRDRRFGLHPTMANLAEMFSQGEAAIISNVGTFDPDFRQASPSLRSAPLTDFGSHSSQITRWQTCSSNARTWSGWAGRMADLLQPQACDRHVAMNLSLSGPNILQLSNLAPPFQCSTTATATDRKKGLPVSVDFDYVNERLAENISRIGRPATKKPRARIQDMTDRQTSELLSSAKEPSLNTRFASDPFSKSLAEITRIVAARDVLNTRRQLFYVSFGGWDHHHQLLTNHASMLSMLNSGLASFRDALRELGVYDDVTTFTVSEFGRSLASNGSGSDHGWGGHQVVFGGSVSGGRLYGEYPDLSPSSTDVLDNGMIVPSTFNEEYFADLANWMGVPKAGLDYVFPQLSALRSFRRKPDRLGLFA